MPLQPYDLVGYTPDEPLPESDSLTSDRLSSEEDVIDITEYIDSQLLAFYATNDVNTQSCYVRVRYIYLNEESARQQLRDLYYDWDLVFYKNKIRFTKTASELN